MLYQNVLKLNSNYRFFDISAPYYCKWCKSKREFVYFNIDYYFIEIIENNSTVFEKFLYEVTENRKRYYSYCNEYKKLSSLIDKQTKSLKGVSQKFFLKIQNDIYNKGKLNPCINPSVICEVVYRTPKGKHYYRNWKAYYYNDIINLRYTAKQNVEQKKIREYQIKMERCKMSHSLRYDVLKRDGFRCQICGASQRDGVRLQVDHIIPVSKGGKTELRNLQTLCERCNLGKSNKI